MANDFARGFPQKWEPGAPFVVGLCGRVCLQGDEQSQQAEAAVGQEAERRLRGQHGDVEQPGHGPQQPGRHVVRHHHQFGLSHGPQRSSVVKKIAACRVKYKSKIECIEVTGNEKA